MFYGPNTKQNHYTLIVTALQIALNEGPLCDFLDLINLQKKNTLKSPEGKYHKNTCAKFIYLLTGGNRSYIENNLSSNRFMQFFQ